ncbi:MAG: ABC transporter permease [Duncaniella sp.]|nr:ABC transporter permease [Duncaniella sp.]
MLSLRIALRYLFAKKSHSAVNVISLVSMAGVAVAAMAMICVLSVFNGFSHLALSRLSLIDAPLRLTPREGAVIERADSLASALVALPGVGEVCPVVEDQAMAIAGDKQVPVIIHGIPEDYGTVSGIESTLIDGEIRQPDEMGAYVTLSVGLALALDVRPAYSSIVRLLVPRRTGRINPAAPLSAFRYDTLVVSGVYETDQQEYDVDRLFMPLDRARRLLDYTTEASALDITPAPGVTEADATRQIIKAAGSKYRVADRLEQEETSFRMIKVEKWVTFLMLVFILVMASFNILSTMSMLIIEKRPGIALLASIGAPASMIKRIFLTQGFLVAAVGGIAGLVTGIILVLLQQHSGFIELGGDHSQMSITSYPVKLMAGDVAVVAAIIAVIGLAAGFISSWRLDTSPVQKT